MKARRLRNALRAVCVLSLLAVVLIVAVDDIEIGEFFFNGDEQAHALTGLYFAELYRVLPLRDPVSFTYNYYGRYPILGIAHWPPVFHAVEGLVLLLNGPSVVSARVTILLFAVIALLYFYALTRYVANDVTAMVGMLLLAFTPAMVLFQKLVMLEVPCLAFCLASAFYLVRYGREQRARDFYLSAVAVGLALLTKHNAIFLPVFALLYLVVRRETRNSLSFARSVRWLALVGIIAGPYYGLIAWTHWKTIAFDLSEDAVSTVDGAVSYLAAIPSQTGWIVLACAALGMIVMIARRQYEVLAFAAAWIVSCLATMSMIGHKEPRYVMYWLPAFALLAAATFGIRTPIRIWPVQAVAAVAILIVLTVQAARFERPYVIGYEEVARQLTARTREGVVLLSAGPGGGNVIFFGNIMDPQRKLFFHRKALAAARWKKEGGYINLVSVPADVDRIVNDHGILYIIHADNAPITFAGQQVLRDYLRLGRFQRVSHVDIQSNVRSHRNLRVVLYENRVPTAPVASSLRIKNMNLGRDIVVPTRSQP